MLEAQMPPYMMDFAVKSGLLGEDTKTTEENTASHHISTFPASIVISR
jgi:hypothetical protein